MDEPTITCADQRRRHRVRDHGDLNGLDYLEVDRDDLHLRLYFLGRPPGWLSPRHLRVEGGQRVTGIRVVAVRIERSEHPELDDYAVVTLDKAGDLDPYTLRIVALDAEGRPTGAPPEGIDPHHAALGFRFRTDCATGLDCRPQDTCPPSQAAEPEIDYQAKDYASFRRLLLDRLALLLPEWRERRVPDLGVTLVELLAYLGDHLSYYQDAVATEAYLETARQRVSVRRHARLVDYRLHEGCNARAWVCVETDGDLDLDPAGVAFLTRPAALTRWETAMLAAEDLLEVPHGQYEVFQPLVAQPEQPLRLRAAHNRIGFHTWGDGECCLPAGSRSATLLDPAPASGDGRSLQLQVGDVLVLEEVLGPRTGNPSDADPTRRHPVRLTRIEPAVDPLDGRLLVEVAWAGQDALPFDLCLSTTGPPPECEPLHDASVARGNVVLADHGRPADDDLGDVPQAAVPQECPTGCCPEDPPPRPGRFRPRLQEAPLTHAEPGAPTGPAAAALAQDPRRALPSVRLVETDLAGATTTWEPRWDLLASGPDDPHVVVEIDDRGLGQVRFGDGLLGRAPRPGSRFHAAYRVGNGPAGNVGAEAIAMVVTEARLSGVQLRPRNPLPAGGGTRPESLQEAKRLAPFVFRSVQQRAVTAEDYARLAERHPDVQRAAGALRWTGSHQEVLVAIDPRGREEADPALLEEVSERLQRYRRIGHDLVVAAARRVPLELWLDVCVAPHHLRGHVRSALLDALSNRLLAGGRAGLFHPDNLSFGEGVFVSRVVAAAQGVAGVRSVEVTRLQRLHRPDPTVLVRSVLPLGPLEIARLDNDPSFPERGRLRLDLRGGR
jgi:hypothetical protein